MSNTKTPLISLSYILAALVFITATADRNLLIKTFIGYKANIIITIIFVIFFLFIFFIPKLSEGYISYPVQVKPVIIILCIIVIYFFFHYLLFPTSFIQIKYSILSFTLVIFLTRKINLAIIINCFAIIGLLLSLALIIQQFLLITFHNGSIQSFDIFVQPNIDFLISRRTFGFVAPYGLGFIENTGAPLFKLGDYSFYRPSLFTHEPKHGASVLILTLAAVFLSELKSDKKKLAMIIHLIALFLLFSLTSWVVLLFSLFILTIYRKTILPRYYVFFIFGFPIITPFFIQHVINLFNSSEGIIVARFLGAVSTSGTGVLSIPSMLGRGAYSGVKNDSDTMLYYIYGQYGLIAFVLIILLFYFLIKYVNANRHFIYYSLWDRYAIILLFNLFIFFSLYVFSDFLSTFSLFIFFFLFHIVNKCKESFFIKSAMVC